MDVHNGLPGLVITKTNDGVNDLVLETTRPASFPAGLDYWTCSRVVRASENWLRASGSVVRFVGATDRNRTGTSELTRSECCRYTTMAP